MKFFKDMSKRTSALLIAAALLLAGGTVTGTRAAFTSVGDTYRAEFYVNHLGVHLIENGEDVCGGSNTIDGKTKVTGALATSLGYSKDGNTETLGTVDPGKDYREEIRVENGADIEEYVRLTVRKYWLRTDENGNTVKATDLSPSLIKLTYKGKDYNTDSWILGEASAESSTYYYRTQLGQNERSELLFDTLTIDKSVIPDMHMPTDAQLKSNSYADYVTVTETNDGATVYTYNYKYDGYTFYVEADVQAIQVHNAEDAIHSQWGVYNVTVNADGSLSVR